MSATTLGSRILRTSGYLALAGLIWIWGFQRVYVPPGRMLVLTSHFGDPNPDPARFPVVDPGVQGIQREALGEGRYFLDPILYDRETWWNSVDVGPLEVGVVERQWGELLPAGEFLAGEGQRGILSEVLTPGRYRLNPLAYRVRIEDAVVIQPGFVGCVTTQAGDEPTPGTLSAPGQRGIQARVLQPGIYYLNPRAFQVVPVEVGFRHIEFTDVAFPSRDGFPVKIDCSVIWGIRPRNVPVILDRFGTVEDVVRKVIKPQVQSICRIEGSKYGAKEFIEGRTRKQFQDTFQKALEEVCKARSLDVGQALLRRIQIPEAVRLPIQQAKIANEELLTKQEQRRTQAMLNDLEELRSDVTKGEREVDAETARQVASLAAQGERDVARIHAEKEVEISGLRKETALVEAEREELLGRAAAEVQEATERARADRLARLAGALGGGEAYAAREFLEELPETLELRLRYAGSGTLWTHPRDEAARDPQALAATRMLQALESRARTGRHSPPGKE